MHTAAHVAVASINQTVGDWSGNHRRIVTVLQVARARGAKLVVLLEMCIPGYSLGDRLLMPGTLKDQPSPNGPLPAPVLYASVSCGCKPLRPGGRATGPTGR